MFPLASVATHKETEGQEIGSTFENGQEPQEVQSEGAVST
jgi:hypothetical protein